MPVWDEKYAVGIESIDREHKLLFGVINRMNEAVRTGRNMEAAAQQAIAHFKRYVIRHFEDEEAWMRSAKYDGYERHRLIHEGMREQVIPRLAARLEASRYSPHTVEQFLGICEKWLTRHIMEQDAELAGCLPKQGGKGRAQDAAKKPPERALSRLMSRPSSRWMSRSRPRI